MKHRITRTTYRNRMATIQEPKRDRLALAERTGHEQCTCDSSSYRWNQCLRIGAGFSGSGEANESSGWYCQECGAPADMGEGDNVPECCSRCGSAEPFEWRD